MLSFCLAAALLRVPAFPAFRDAAALLCVPAFPAFRPAAAYSAFLSASSIGTLLIFLYSSTATAA